MSEERDPSCQTGRCEVVSARTYSAPRDAVFAAFADSEALVHWWGPKGFTNTFREFDLRPGGAWRFSMHAPNGKEYQIEKAFMEVIPGERIVLQHAEPNHRFQMTMTFADAPDGGTRLTWRMVFEPDSWKDGLAEYLSKANEENFDRLESFLRQQAASRAK